MDNYLFYSTTGLGISYLLYYFFLKKEQGLLFTRIYLLGSLILCLLAPILNFEFGNSIPHVPQVNLSRIVSSSSGIFEEAVEGETVPGLVKDENFIFDILPIIYLLVTTLLLFRFCKNLLQLVRKIRRKHPFELNNLKLILIEEKGDPFSFFHYLFINKEDFKNLSYSKLVIKHEEAHSKQLHSVDILLLELLSSFFWFNPFIWLYKRAIVLNHEYLADSAVIASGVDLITYSQQLIDSGAKNRNFSLISGFNFVQVKNRLAMLHRTKSATGVRVAKFFSVLLIFAIVFTLSSFSRSSIGEQSVRVIEGNHFDNHLNEKIMTLLKKSQIKEGSGNIKVIITPQWDREKLDSTVIALSKKNITFRYSELEFSSENELQAIRIEVDCNDFHSGGASTENLSESLNFGFIRNYNIDAERQFAIGALSIYGIE